MTPETIARNPFARHAELMRRIERQAVVETVLFRAALIVLAVVGAWLIWLRNSYAGPQAIPTDAVITLVYWGFIAIKFRDDIRN